MESIDVATWEEFEDRLSSLTEDRLKIKTTKGNMSAEYANSHLKFLFRGQSNAEWKLQTTLDRFKPSAISLFDYYRAIDRARPEIETITGHKWNKMKDYGEYRDWLKIENFYTDFPGYDYMIYLRHHGYPSPLLDWTRSPYIAALFAFSDFSISTSKVSIYLYQQSATGNIGFEVHAPHIRCFPHLITSHKRHFLQKSAYTICVRLDNSSKEWLYAQHDQIQRRPEQNLIWKFNIPASERIKVLQKLEDFNLNLYSIFQTEESLMSAIAARQYHLQDKDNIIGSGYSHVY